MFYSNKKVCLLCNSRKKWTWIVEEICKHGCVGYVDKYAVPLASLELLSLYLRGVGGGWG